MVSAGLADAFAGRRVLITGDTGFKGSWLALRMHELGAEVTGFALPDDDPRSHFRLLGLDRLIRHVDGDVRELANVRSVVEQARPEIVFHLAAQALVRRSFDQPKLTFDTNVGGTVNVLEALREAPDLRALVCITSDKCYHNMEWVWGYRECDRLGGRDPYSASKAAAEMAFAAYADAFFAARSDVGVATARAGNVIGGGDWSADRLLPDCIRALEAGRPIVLRRPEATRPWQHVLESVSAYSTLAAALANEPRRYAGSWNFGPEVNAVRTVHEVAEMLVRLWGEGSVRVERNADDPHEATLLQLNIDKAKLQLGWRPRWGVDRAIAETVAWYREVIGGKPALETTRAQMLSYDADAEKERETR